MLTANQVRKTSQAALLVLLEQEVVERGGTIEKGQVFLVHYKTFNIVDKQCTLD